jgi:hypothetical protein
MFNIFEELTWPQFTQLTEITRLPLNEQTKYYNQYLYDLSIARQNWLDTQGKGLRPSPIIVENGFLLQENLFNLLQEDGFKITTTTIINA